MKPLWTAGLLTYTLLAGGLLAGCEKTDSVYKPAVAKLMEDAQHLKQQNQLPSAICRLESAVVLAPETPQVHYNLGVLYAEANQWTSAIDHLKEATRLDPKFENAWYTLGYAHAALGDTLAATFNASPQGSATESGDLKLTPAMCYQESQRAYQQYLKLAPNGPQAKSANEQLERLKSQGAS